MEKINRLIEIIDSCSLSTQIIMLIAFIVICFVVWKLMTFVITFIKIGFKTEKLLTFIQKLIRIIIPLELKTIAGLINLLMTIVLLIVTFLVFISASISGMLGFTENVSVNKLILIILTILVGSFSLWALYKFDKESKLLKNGSA